MDFSEFLVRLTAIKKKGFILSHREGSTGIGKTLEDLLGIRENNIEGPDFSVYELKSGREDSSSMLTLFTKTPQPNGAIKELLDIFGYPQRGDSSRYTQETLTGEEANRIRIGSRENELHSTVDAIRPNPQGLILKVTDTRLYIDNEKNIQAYYDWSALKDAFEAKYYRLIYVLAQRRKTPEGETFWYNEAYRLINFGFNQFKSLISEGLLKVDLRVGHFPNGRVHDHGTAFRILPKYLPRCFETMEQIL